MTWTEITAKLAEAGYHQRQMELHREVWQHPGTGDRVTITTDRAGRWAWDREPAGVK